MSRFIIKGFFILIITLLRFHTVSTAHGDDMLNNHLSIGLHTPASFMQRLMSFING